MVTLALTHVGSASLHDIVVCIEYLDIDGLWTETRSRAIAFDPVSVHQLSQHSQLVVSDLKYLTAVNHAHRLERVASLPIVCLYVCLSTSFHAIFQKGLKLGSPNLVHAGTVVRA